MKLGLDSIRADGEINAREQLDNETVAAYAELMREGTAFSAVVVFQDGADNWLADGFHRVAAARQANLTELEADVRPGTKRDAILFAFGANAIHGLPLSNADKHLVVGRLLHDPDWVQWSDRAIAKHCGVSPPLCWSDAQGVALGGAKGRGGQRFHCKRFTVPRSEGPRRPADGDR
jgi:hypothetical protein